MLRLSEILHNKSLIKQILLLPLSICVSLSFLFFWLQTKPIQSVLDGLL